MYFISYCVFELYIGIRTLVLTVYTHIHISTYKIPTQSVLQESLDEKEGKQKIQTRRPVGW